MREFGSTWTLRAAAAVAGVAVLLSGCGGGSSAAPATTPSATAVPATFTTEQAAVALDEVIWTIRAQGTGTFHETGEYTYPKGKGTRHGYERNAGSYDLRGERWQAQRTFSVDDEGKYYEESRRAIGPIAYVQDRYIDDKGHAQPWYAWPGLGRTPGTEMTTTFGTLTTPAPLYLLSRFAVTGMRGTQSGDERIINGNVPLSWALYAAGVGEVFDTDKVSAYDLEGSVPAELLVSAAGTPSTLTLDFSKVEATGPKVSDAWREAITKTEYRASFNNPGTTIDIDAPSGAVTVDPPETARTTSPDPDRARV